MSQNSFNDARNAKPQKRRLTLVFLILSVSIFACLAGIVILGVISFQAYKDSPKLVEGLNVPSEYMTSHALSQEQIDIISVYGYPDSFSIFFYVEEFDSRYEGEVRDESWRYYASGLEFTFYNGALIAEEHFTIPHGELAPNLYKPEQFTAYATVEEVLASAEIHDLIELPLEEALIPNGILYYAPGLSFGLVGNRLVYVETITLEMEESTDAQQQ